MSEKSLSIGEIVIIEPRIKALLEDAKRIHRADWWDYTLFKKQLYHLVGFRSPYKELRTCTAYEVAIHALCDALKV